MSKSARKKGLGRFLKATALVLVTLIAVAALTAWFMRDKIVSMVLDIAETQLAEEGLYIHRSSHDLSWQHGIILNQLDLFVDEERTARLARIDKIGLRIPLLELFHDNPSLHLRAQDSALSVETSAGEFRMDQVGFSMTSTSGSLSIHHLDSRLRNLRITAHGILHWQKDETRKTIEIPDLSPLVKVSTWMDFPEGEPTLALEFNTNDTAPNGIDLKGHLTGQRFTWRNMDVERMDLRAVLADDGVEIRSMDADCYGGNIKGSLTVDFENRRLEVTKITSSLDPFRFVDAVMDRELLGSFHSLGPTSLDGSDLVFDLGDFSRSSGILTAAAPDGISMEFDGKKIVMKDFHGKVRFADRELVVEDASFTTLGGRGSGSYRMPLHGEFSYHLKLKADGVSLKQLAREHGLKETLVGRGSATFDGGGASGSTSHFGKGQISVEDGDFYEVVFLGSLQAMLTQQSPKFGMDKAHELNCSYTLENGTIRSDDLRLESAATKILAKGHIDMVQETLDADVRANLKGVPGVATDLISRIFTFHGEGPLNDVHWKLKGTPEIVRGATDATIEGTKKATEGAGKIVDDVGNATKKLLDDRPGFLIPKKKKARD